MFSFENKFAAEIRNFKFYQLMQVFNFKDNSCKILTWQAQICNKYKYDDDEKGGA